MSGESVSRKSGDVPEADVRVDPKEPAISVDEEAAAVLAPNEGSCWQSSPCHDQASSSC